MQQVHGSRVVLVSKMNDGETIKDCDGLITNDPSVTLSVRTADCLPISIKDKNNKAIALIHAGWRGLNSGIIKNAIRLMKEKFRTNATSVQVVIGPHICVKHYEVGPEVSVLFDNKKNLDLSKVAINQLTELGVVRKNINVDRRCTFEDPDLPSFRKNKTSERLITELHV